MTTLLCIHIWAGCAVIMFIEIYNKEDNSWAKFWSLLASIGLGPLIATMVMLEKRD